MHFTHVSTKASSDVPRFALANTRNRDHNDDNGQHHQHHDYDDPLSFCETRTGLKCNFRKKKISVLKKKGRNNDAYPVLRWEAPLIRFHSVFPRSQQDSDRSNCRQLLHTAHCFHKGNWDRDLLQLKKCFKKTLMFWCNYDIKKQNTVFLCVWCIVWDGNFAVTGVCVQNIHINMFIYIYIHIYKLIELSHLHSSLVWSCRRCTHNFPGRS